MKKKYLLLIFFIINNYLISQNINFVDPNFKYSLVNDLVVDTDGDGNGDIDADTNDDGEISIEEAEVVENLLFWFNNYSSVKELENFINLEKLLLYDNNLSTLDITKNIKLKELRCSRNNISELDLSNNLDLEFLWVPTNKLENLDVSTNTLLFYIDIGYNKIASFNTTLNPNLIYLVCTNNELESLNIKNSKNSTLTNFNSIGNANLTCIQVDDIDYSENQSTWFKDDSSTYQIDCNSLSIVDFDLSKEIRIYPNPTSNSIALGSKYLNSIKKVELFNTQGKVVFQKYKNIKTLELSNLTRGVYFLKISTEFKSTTKKIIKL